MILSNIITDKFLIKRFVILFVLIFIVFHLLNVIGLTSKREEYIIQKMPEDFCETDACVRIDFEVISEHKIHAVGDNFRYKMKIKNIGKVPIKTVFLILLEPNASFSPSPEGKKVPVCLEPGETLISPTVEEIKKFPQVYTFSKIDVHRFKILPPDQYDQNIHFFDWDDLTRAHHGLYIYTFDIISRSDRDLQQRSERAQWVAIGASVVALAITAYSTIQSKKLQQTSSLVQMSSVELQHRIKMNEILGSYKGKLSKRKKKEIKTWTLLHLNLYETLAYCVNKKYIKEKDVYELWHKIIREIYEKLYVNVEEGDFKELKKLINKWKIKYRW